MTISLRLNEQAETLAQITRQLAQCCISKESEIFSQFEISASEGQVLLAVSEGCSSPSGLAEQLGVGRSRITPLVQNLVNKRLLQRTESPEDRRAHDLRLTREGKDVATKAMNYRLGFHTRLLEKFSESERTRLLDTLEELFGKMTETRKTLKI